MLHSEHKFSLVTQSGVQMLCATYGPKEQLIKEVYYAAVYYAEQMSELV